MNRQERKLKYSQSIRLHDTALTVLARDFSSKFRYTSYGEGLSSMFDESGQGPRIYDIDDALIAVVRTIDQLKYDT